MNLTTFKINDTTPFYSPADTANETLSQVHALLSVIASTEQVCDAITDDEADAYRNMRNGIKGRALDGVATLVAFTLYNLDMASEAPLSGNWGQLVSNLQTTKARLDEHSQSEGRLAAANTPECEAHEAKTAQLAEEHSEAFDAVMLFPAPDRKALAFKTRTYWQFVGEDAWHTGAQILKQIAADAERLA